METAPRLIFTPESYCGYLEEHNLPWKREWAGPRVSTYTNFGVKRSEEHTSELQSLTNLVCRLLLEKKNKKSESSQQTPITRGDAKYKTFRAKVPIWLSKRVKLSRYALDASVLNMRLRAVPTLVQAQ